MFARRSSIVLFPTQVWTHALTKRDAAQVNDAVLSIVDDVHADRRIWRRRGHRRPFEDLHTRPQLLPLTRKIEAETRQIIEELAVDSDSFRITQCRAEIEPKWQVADGWRLEQHHYLSGIYVVQVPNDSAVVFHDPRMQTNNVDIHYHEVTDMNATSAFVPVDSGSLLLFPSWLPRSINNQRAEQACITLSFNVMVYPRRRSQSYGSLRRSSSAQTYDPSQAPAPDQPSSSNQNVSGRETPK